MKRLLVYCSMLLLLYSSMPCVKAQDTLQLSCPDTAVQLISLRPSIKYMQFKGTVSCDSVYVLSAWKYRIIQRDLKACKNFVQLYKFYRDEVKKGDVEVSAIVDGYEKIIKTKDSAYNKLMDEYHVLNHLLDSSITQTGTAVNLSQQSLRSLQSSLDTMSQTNENLRADVGRLQTINRRTKWQFGIGGFIVGVLVGFLIAK